MPCGTCDDKVYASMAKIRTHDNVNKGTLTVAGIYF